MTSDIHTYSGSRPSYGKKVFLMGLICVPLMIGVLAVWILTFSRELTSNSVADEIAHKWGSMVYITGPVVRVDMDDSDGESPYDQGYHTDSPGWMGPQTFDCEATVETSSLHRGIYEAEVFTSHVRMSGAFSPGSLQPLGDTVMVKLDVDPGCIEQPASLTIGDRQLEWTSFKDYLFAKVNVADMSGRVEFSTEFNVRGSGALFIRPTGEQSTVTISGDASNPSFDGKTLPVDRQLSGRVFSARWEEKMPARMKFSSRSGYVGTSFLVGVDRYQKVSRSMKYSFIIIVLTFISVLFVEIVKRHPIPLLNYFLIGAALILFYSLLLSFTELVPFGWAYLVASVMTIALIAGYIWKILGSRSLGMSIGAVLAVMYLLCFIMLSISDGALLVGSLLLFFALAAMMYGSLKINSN